MRGNTSSNFTKYRTGNRAVEPSSSLLGYYFSSFSAIFGTSYLIILATAYGLNIIDARWYIIGSIAFLAAIVALCAPRIIKLESKHLTQNRDIVGIALFLFAAWGLISCFYAAINIRIGSNIDMWQQFFSATSSIILFYVYRSIVWDRRLWGKVNYGWALVTFITIGTMLAHILGIASGEAYGSRQFGILGDPVAWILSALCVVHLARRGWIAFVMCGLLLAITESRAPALFAAAGIVLVLMLEPAKSLPRLLKKMSAAGGLGATLVLAPVFVPNLVTRFRETDFLYNDRVETLRFGLQLFRESPWLGSGFNSQNYFYALRFGVERGRFMILDTSVSTPVQILSDFGIVGFILFAIAMLGLIKACLFVARAPAAAIPRGTSMRFYNITRGLACWLVPFILFNHSAAYLTPQSLVGTLFFCAAGMVVALDGQLRAAGVGARRKKSRISQPTWDRDRALVASR